MEMKLILGPNDSGKSLYAEKLAEECGEPRIYLATMVPQTSENYERIEKHRMQRRDKGFVTVEEPWNIQNIEVNKNTAVLLEDASNLLANGIFQYQSDGKQALERICGLSEKCKMLIIVSISGLTDQGYDAETVHYLNELNWLNEQLCDLAESVYIMCDGEAVIQK